jgi:hypothetical protein
MRNSASALALQLSLDFDQIVAFASEAIARDSGQPTFLAPSATGPAPVRRLQRRWTSRSPGRGPCHRPGRAARRTISRRSGT